MCANRAYGTTHAMQVVVFQNIKGSLFTQSCQQCLMSTTRCQCHKRNQLAGGPNGRALGGEKSDLRHDKVQRPPWTEDGSIAAARSANQELAVSTLQCSLMIPYIWLIWLILQGTKRRNWCGDEFQGWRELLFNCLIHNNNDPPLTRPIMDLYPSPRVLPSNAKNILWVVEILIFIKHLFELT